MASGPIGSQQRSTAAEHRTAEQGDRASHFANLLGKLAEPLLGASPSVVPSQSSAGDGEKNPEGAARRAVTAAVTAASSALFDANKIAKQGLVAVKNMLEAAEQHINPETVVAKLKNTEPSLICDRLFFADTIGDFNQRQSMPAHAFLQRHIEELVDFTPPMLDEYTEPSIYSCKITAKGESFSLDYFCYKFVMQHKKDSKPITFYFRRNILNHSSYGVCTEPNGLLLKGKLTSSFGFSSKSLDCEQEGEFQHIQVNGKSHSVLLSGTFRLYIRDSQGTKTIVRKGKFFYNTENINARVKNPEAYLSLVQGRKVVYAAVTPISEEDEKTALTLIDQTGKFKPLSGTDMLKREEFIPARESTGELISATDAEVPTTQDPFLPFEDPFKPAQ